MVELDELLEPPDWIPPWVGDEEGVFFEDDDGAEDPECFGLMFGGVTFSPPVTPELGGFGLTNAPVDPGRKFFGDNFGETADDDPLDGGYLGDTVLGGYFGDVVGPRIPDPVT